YRHMHGFGSHTYSFINDKNEKFWVKFHFITQQGIKNFTDAEATTMKGKDPDHAQRDLVTSIEKGEFPKWILKVQVMPERDAKDYRWNPFDLTKVWSHKDYPLIDVGVLELNQIPENYFRDVEQAAFAPANVVNGISYSPDKMLQGRLLSYPDAQRYRLGVNFEQIPVNRCPFEVNNYHRDGLMRVDENGGSDPNYLPNSFDNIIADESYRQLPMDLESTVADWYDRNAPGENDHYTQPGLLFRNVMNDTQKKNTINNIVGAMQGISGAKKEEIMRRMIHHWYMVDVNLGSAIARGLGLATDPFVLPAEKKQRPVMA
ncbi:MAG: catalase, partial [Chitinophagales bacterium]